MISAPVLAAAKRRGVKPRRDPWGSIALRYSGLKRCTELTGA
jgi:hypothetical protein